MTIKDMRIYISNHPKYKDSPGWKLKVMNMKEHQVYAIYMRFKQQDYRKIAKEINAIKKNNENYHQIDIFEYLDSLEKKEEKV